MKKIEKDGTIYEEDKDGMFFDFLILFDGIGLIFKGIWYFISMFLPAREEPKIKKRVYKRRCQNRKKQIRKII